MLATNHRIVHLLLLLQQLQKFRFQLPTLARPQPLTPSTLSAHCLHLAPQSTHFSIPMTTLHVLQLLHDLCFDQRLYEVSVPLTSEKLLQRLFLSVVRRKVQVFGLLAGDFF